MPPGRSNRAATGIVTSGAVKLSAPVIAEHDVKAAVGKRRVLRRGMHKLHIDARFRDGVSRVIELALRIVQRRATRATFRERD